ncbi:hypothetical protein SADUNF_Sadunf15G0045700 [Salix dunnii]|uniref:MER3 helicase-like winged helix domain-containing protein n=1 Tax=Salix dunnii TaxID=1413687 RepID=A0A835JFZ1_9ROSI|nr:hypothetical protein SADUNF_Sadunf15G0045700 [Salix dunnii]
MNDWRKHHVTQLGKTMLEMTGDYTPDAMALLSVDIIISTPEKWDGISRNWHRRSYVTKESIVDLSLSDLADWLGVGEIGLFNFKPSVRPVPLEVHIQAIGGEVKKRQQSCSMDNHTTWYSVKFRLLAEMYCSHSFATLDEHPRQFLSVTEEMLQMVLSQVTDQNLKHTVRFGIGLHHAANMCVEIFLWPSLPFPSGSVSGPMLRLVGGSNCMHEHISVEIVMGTICHKNDAMHYLAWTCLFSRLVINNPKDCD